MKKKRLFCFLMIAAMSFSVVNAISPILLQVEIIDPEATQDNPQRAPIARPSINLDGFTLNFNNVGYDLTLVLLDEDGEEAYTTFVPAGTTAVMLPSTLSGDYELQLLPGGSFYFYTIVTL